eukprot:CAMPEP_0195072198 /NCGR_PEP_ID=MMETSP0448-20130528/15842_1 /TAXON_ID=66468 /ORGANISM="Heterocapsa triquestra, Strain CCMP 448" /LENGTH=93 /DNA_ID=CAMNT_0040104147 /DNA_START=1 /DNA_END=279 /DNA_ORIENTATION=+
MRWHVRSVLRQRWAAPRTGDPALWPAGLASRARLPAPGLFRPLAPGVGPVECGGAFRLQRLPTPCTERASSPAAAIASPPWGRSSVTSPAASP